MDTQDYIMKNTVFIKPKILKSESQALTDLDLKQSESNFTAILFYEKKLRIDNIIHKVQKALEIFPEFSGRICIKNGKKLVDKMHSGIPLTINKFNQKINRYSIEFPAGDLSDLFIHDYKDTANEDTPVFSIKYTEFNDGCIIGISVSHMFCDGASMWSFLKLCSSKNLREDNIVKHSRRDLHRIVNEKPSRNLRPEPYDFFYKNSESPYYRSTRFFELEYEKKLGAYYQKSNNIYSRQDLITSYIWKLAAKSKLHTGQESCSLSVIIDMRKTLGFSDYFIGNLFHTIVIERDSHYISNLPTPLIASEIRSEIKKIGIDEVRDDLYAWKTAPSPAPGQQEAIAKAFKLYMEGKSLLINNWFKFPIFEIDFGESKPFWFETSKKHVIDGAVLMLPNSRNETTINIQITLPIDEMEAFTTLISEACN
jgi:hypothetical protein